MPEIALKKDRISCFLQNSSCRFHLIRFINSMKITSSLSIFYKLYMGIVYKKLYFTEKNPAPGKIIPKGEKNKQEGAYIW